MSDTFVPWALGLAALVLYLPALGAGFFFDDRHLIIDNPFLRDPGALWSLLIHPRSSTGLASDMYRPLTTATLMANYAVGGLRPFGYHLVNLLLHWANGVLAYRLLRAILPRAAWVAVAAAAACFVAHPVQSSAVAYVASRSTLLAGCGVLLSLWAYRQSCVVSQHRSAWRALSLASFVAALAAKETPVVLPALVILLDVTVWSHHLRGRPEVGQQRPSLLTACFAGRAQVVGWLPFVLVAVAYVAGRRVIIGAIGPLALVRPGWFNLGVACQAVWLYLRLLVAPGGLCLTRVVDAPSTAADPLALVAMAGYAALCIAVALWIRRRPLWAAALGWFLIALAPSHPMANLYLNAADHHLYLPSIGAMIALAALIDAGWRRRRGLTGAALAVGLAACGVVTWQRSVLWGDEVRVWESTVRQAPRMVMAWNNLGEVYLRRGRLDDAERAFVRALRLGGMDRGTIIGNLGRVIAGRGTHATALPLLQLAVRYSPRSPSLLTALGCSLSHINRFDEAERAYRQALAINPAAVDVYNNWGVDAAVQGRLDEAVRILRDGVRWDADRSDLGRNLARALALQGNVLASAREWTRVSRLPDGTAGDGLNAALAYAAMHDEPSAVAVLEQVVRRAPDDAAAQYHLGRLYGLLGRPEALAALQRAVTLQPSWAEAQYDLAVTYSALAPPRLDLARYHAQEAQRLGYAVPPALVERLAALDARH